jgi:hypothetical protein
MDDSLGGGEGAGAEEKQEGQEREEREREWVDWWGIVTQIEITNHQSAATPTWKKKAKKKHSLIQNKKHPQGTKKQSRATKKYIKKWGKQTKPPNIKSNKRERERKEALGEEKRTNNCRVSNRDVRCLFDGTCIPPSPPSTAEHRDKRQRGSFDRKKWIMAMKSKQHLFEKAILCPRIAKTQTKNKAEKEKEKATTIKLVQLRTN